MKNIRNQSRGQAGDRAPSSRRICALLVILAAASAGCAATGTDGDRLAVDESAVSAVDVETLSQELTAELERAGLESVASAIAEIDLSSLVDDEEFTLLAPTDDAFLVASADELADLLADPDALLAVLRNHVIPMTLHAGELTSVSTVRTHAGHELDVSSLEDGTLVIGGATVVAADTTVGDGVVHTIDRLLIPEHDG